MGNRSNSNSRSITNAAEPGTKINLMMTELETIFYNNYGSLEEDEIIKINNQFGTGELNNVVVGLNKHCYGLFLMDDKVSVIYRIFYVNGEGKLTGDILELTAQHPERDSLVFMFAKFLSEKYDGLDIINSFNTFQQHTRTLLEKIGYLTIDSISLNKYNDQNPSIIAKGVKGIIPITILDRVEFYKDFFDNKELTDIKEGQEFVYLMLNKRSGFVKIGKSQNPTFREKTLQSQEPEIILITYWKVPKIIEKELHQQFKDKRQRGEWFNLTFHDLKLVKEQMKIHEENSSN